MRPALRRLFGVAFVGAAIAAVGFGVKYKLDRPAAAEEPGTPTARVSATDPVRVEVVKPGIGGIRRETTQPGSLEPMESADLFAKVSGFLLEQSVDIGSRVARGQVLAKIAIPEYESALVKAAAEADRAQSGVRQAEARIAAAEAEARSATVNIALAKSTLKSRSSYRSFREKQYARLKELNAQQAIEARVVDESLDQLAAATEAEVAAREGIGAAEEKVGAAKAHIDLAKADLEFAKASVRVAAAERERAQVLVDYATIRSPYDGVVTRRSFSRGDFLRSADTGGERVPMLSVERTDMMRVVVLVPDRDVPYVDVGDIAEVDIDALPRLPIRAAISRSAQSEDTSTRTMRTEIDIPNPDGRLRRGMYGRVRLTLQEANPNSFTVPSSAIDGKREGGRGSVRVARGGIAVRVPVVLGPDNGVQVEILSGLKADDAVIVRANGPLEDGAAAVAGGP